MTERGLLQVPENALLSVGGICLALGLFASGAAQAQSVPDTWLCNFQLENDVFLGGTDRHYTHGTRLGCLSRRIQWIEALADQVPWFSLEQAQAKDSATALEARASLTLGQNIYTPEDITIPTLIKEDRPYAGWLYLGMGLVANQGPRRYDKLELELGVIGPASGAEEVQETWHRQFDFRQPQGWQHQLKNEPGINFYYEQARRLHSTELAALPLKAQAIPHFGFALGNVFTYGAAGLTLRIGNHLGDDFGPPRIRPSLPGSGLLEKNAGLNWYLFAGVEGRVVLRNIFLDGNSFRDSHSVDKYPFVGDLQAGLALQYHDLRISYTQILRSREYRGQDHTDRFGAINLSWRF